VNAPQISHTITVSTKTDLGTQSAPTIQTCVSMGAGDTIMWIGSDGNLKFDWVTPSGPKPYDPSSCNGTTASCTATFQSGSWTVNQYFDYTLNVGGSHPICGRIIIKP